MSPFDNINSRNKQKLLRLLKADVYEYKAGKRILEMIYNDNIICVILEGQIEIIRTDYNGNKTVIEELEEDDIFGNLISILNNKENEIITKKETKILAIDYNTIVNYEENSKGYYNEFIKNLFKMVVQKLNNANKRINIITKKTIRNKLLEYFNTNSYGHQKKYVYLPFNLTKLADYLSVDRTAMSRELKSLKDEGFIEINKKRITLFYK
ncbi:MAG: Crp/Fnr family transcriptional regulator [Tenericutes bacterium]|nr:Crp/Fnr family transcriptional regulator [Mycoplasmatota bacterium]